MIDLKWHRKPVWVSIRVASDGKSDSTVGVFQSPFVFSFVILDFDVFKLRFCLTRLISFTLKIGAF